MTTGEDVRLDLAGINAALEVLSVVQATDAEVETADDARPYREVQEVVIGGHGTTGEDACPVWLRLSEVDVLRHAIDRVRSYAVGQSGLAHVLGSAALLDDVLPKAAPKVSSNHA